MVKINRGVVERMLIACGYLQAQGYNCLGFFQDAARTPIPEIPNPGETLVGITRQGITNKSSYIKWPDLINHFKEQLELPTDTTDKHHPTLINLIIDLISGSYSRNVLSGGNLRSLRKAVLFPEELVKVSESAKRDLACATCGKPFIQGEMATAMMAEDGTNAMIFTCVVCACPTHAACHHRDSSTGLHCDESQEIDTRIISKILGKAICGAHNPKQKPEPQPNVAPTPRQPPETLAENWVTIGREAAATRQDQIREGVARAVRTRQDLQPMGIPRVWVDEGENDDPR